MYNIKKKDPMNISLNSFVCIAERIYFLPVTCSFEIEMAVSEAISTSDICWYSFILMSIDPAIVVIPTRKETEKTARGTSFAISKSKYWYFCSPSNV
jgi:hypothetical protein